MGYTTTFKGRFVFDRLPSAQTIAKLRTIEGEEVQGGPDSYCDWSLTKDCMGLEWSGAEKFYHYVEWLQFIYETYLKPDGVAITGAVTFQGEARKDFGKLVFENSKFVKRQEALIADDIKTLTAFRDFVLESDFADEILEKWERSRE